MCGLCVKWVVYVGRKWAFVVGSVAALVAALACGAGSNADEAPAPGPDGGGGQNTRTKTSGTDLSKGEHPGGLFRSAPTSQPCPNPVRVGIGNTGLTLQRASEIRICFVGFEADGEQVEATLQGPDGTKRDLEPTSLNGDWTVRIVATSKLPLGKHTLTATQQGNEATTRVTVVRATDPSVLQVDGDEGRMAVELAGFPPGEQVAAFLYGPEDGGRYPFNRPLPVAKVNGKGEGTYAVKADPDDEEGAYKVWFRPEACESDFCPGYTKQ